MRKTVYIIFMVFMYDRIAFLPVFSLPVSRGNDGGQIRLRPRQQRAEKSGADIKQLLEPVWHQIRKVFEQR
ncbi:MAG: hypothetical protein L6V93_10440 [Clostridiales bacterium]|nr:MAG: hypothetical protein L6V93_10440 [Clostridiales bacterium]